MANPTIGFIGLGKLGLPVAATLSFLGCRVLGYDVNPEVAGYLRNKEVPFTEESLDSVLSRSNIQLLTSIEAVVRESDIIFCAVQTPHRPEFAGDTVLELERADFDYKYLISAVRSVSLCDLDKILVVISTCLPGTYREVISPILNGSRVRYVYNPFFIAMGTVIKDFVNPEFVLLGHENDMGAVEEIKSFYLRFLGDRCKFLVTDITTAEGVKVFYNTYITAKTVLANTFGEFAHKLGMNVDHITEALSMATDRIISPKYLKSGVGDGGCCHPRDNIALSYCARKIGLSNNLFDDLMMAREDHMQWLAKIFVGKAQEMKLPAVVLGKSFKPESNITTGSAAMLFADILKSYYRGTSFDFKHYEFEPFVPEKAIYFIATQHQVYRTFPFLEGSVVIDPFRYIPHIAGVEVIGIGSGKNEK